MDSENTNTDMNSSILKLESLNATYNNLLIQYQQAILNYVNYENNLQNNPSTQQNFISIQGKTFWGTSSIVNNSSTNSTTVEECQASCASTSGCTGATFNLASTGTGTPLCSLRSGDGKLTIGNQSDYAIVPEGKQLLLIIDHLNNKLTKVNKKIQILTVQTQSTYEKEVDQRNNKNQNLLSQYEKLSEERNNVAKMIAQFDELDVEQNEGTIMTNQKYYLYLLYLAISILVLYILFRFSLSNSNNIAETSNIVLLGVCFIIFVFGIQYYNMFLSNLAHYISSLNVSTNFTGLLGYIFNIQVLVFILFVGILLYYFYFYS